MRTAIAEYENFSPTQRKYSLKESLLNRRHSLCLFKGLSNHATIAANLLDKFGVAALETQHCITFCASHCGKAPLHSGCNVNMDSQKAISNSKAPHCCGLIDHNWNKFCCFCIDLVEFYFHTKFISQSARQEKKLRTMVLSSIKPALSIYFHHILIVDC